jgi:hypothetical protein
LNYVTKFLSEAPMPLSGSLSGHLQSDRIETFLVTFNVTPNERFDLSGSRHGFLTQESTTPDRSAERAMAQRA